MQSVRGYDVVAGRQEAAVDDEQQVGCRRSLVGAEPRPLAQVGRQQGGQVVERGRDHPHRADGVGLLGRQRVGQPLHPVPVGEVLLGGEHRYLEVVRRLERRGAADHRPGERPRLLLGPADLDAVEGPQVDRRRQVGQQPMDHKQAVQRRRRRRVDLVDDRRLGCDQVERERLRAQPVADVEEARVGGVVLPDPGPLLGQRRQRARRGVLPGQRAALLVGGLAGHLAHVGEVAQVLGPRTRQLLGALLALPVDLHDDEADGGEQEHARGEVAAATARRAADAGHEHDGAEAAEHRDGVHHDAAGTFVLLELRRRLEHDLARGHLGPVQPPAPKRGAHCSSC